MQQTKVLVDYNQITGKMKPMHCVNGGPRDGGRLLVHDFTAEFKHMGVPYARLHDIEYPYGLNRFVDIHCIFPDFDADVDDPASYNFEPTDRFLQAIRDADNENRTPDIVLEDKKAIENGCIRLCVKPKELVLLTFEK